MSAYRCFDVTENDGVSVVRFRVAKIIEDHWINQMKEELFRFCDELAGSGNVVHILITFENVDFFSSAALGGLMHLDKMVKRGGGKLVCCSMRAEVYEVFTITKLNRLFTIVNSAEQALRMFAAVA